MPSTEEGLGGIYAIFGTSAGEIEFHRINIRKMRLEMVQNKACNLRFKEGSVLTMRRLKLKDAFVVIVGLSSGDIALISVGFKEEEP